jgi:uncharacterized protein (TIGR03083 family)
MNTTVTPTDEIRALDRTEALELATAEFDRIVELLRSLDAREWSRPTDCPLWDVRALVGHIVGAAEGQASVREFAHQMRAAKKRTEGSMIDAMTATQVRERAQLSSGEIVERLAIIAPKAVRGRRRLPAPVRKMRMKVDPPFDNERWTLGYLYDVIFNRDAWMHRVDLSRATGRAMVLTAQHDGRIVADVVAEWARRHRQPFMLTLTGPAGGSYVAGDGGERLELDAVQFCRILSGRADGAGLLTTEVPF